ncbi:MAG TPA: hypothetical protein VKH15_16050 [Candidatus Acidoferrum sp.]|nr:hypothetical protein [Candidatus Acidoferrum sp.]
MTDQNEKELKELLKQSIAPFTNSDLRRDLWPQMLQRLSHQPIRVPWFDWALAAILAALLLLFPGTIPALLYHL